MENLNTYHIDACQEDIYKDTYNGKVLLTIMFVSLMLTLKQGTVKVNTCICFAASHREKQNHPDENNHPA